LRDTVRRARRHARFLIALAALVWLPLALLELAGAAHGLRGDVDDFDVGELARLPTLGEFLRTVPWGALHYALLDRERFRTRNEPAGAGSS
jgi:hypothetical protein